MQRKDNAPGRGSPVAPNGVEVIYSSAGREYRFTAHRKLLDELGHPVPAIRCDGGCRGVPVTYQAVLDKDARSGFRIQMGGTALCNACGARRASAAVKWPDELQVLVNETKSYEENFKAWSQQSLQDAMAKFLDARTDQEKSIAAQAVHPSKSQKLR